MMLNSTTVNKTPLPSQLNLYNAGQAYNNALPAAQQTSYATSPGGMQATLAAQDPTRTYTAYNIAPGIIPADQTTSVGYNQAIATLAYNIDHYQVPGSILINRGAHWIDVYGENTNHKPTSANDATLVVNGFDTRDPGNGFQGLVGTKKYLANTADGFQKDFTVQGYGNWKWAGYLGNFCFVTDPDPDTADTDATPVDTGVAVPNSSAAALDATADDASIPSIANDPSFQGGSFDTSPADDILVHLDNGGEDWLVPYDQSGGISGADLIDPTTGVLDQAWWADPGQFDTLAQLDADIFKDANDNTPDDIVNDNQVPEPTSIALLGLVIIPLGARRKRTAAPRHMGGAA